MSIDKNTSRSSIIFILTVVAVLLAGTLFMGSTSAIINGQPDDDGHPAVCAVTVYDEYGDFIGFGSGTLISPTVVLTAGHVTILAYYVIVYFGEDAVNNPIYMGTGTPHTYPDFYMPSSMAGGLFNFHGDVGVVVLDEPVPSSVVSPADYGLLPTAGAVDTLSQKAPVDLVGYGFNELVTGEGMPYFDEYGIRYNATCDFIRSNYVASEEFMKLSGNPSKDKGGTTFGDSGGPVLMHGTNTILGITSFGPSYWCKSTWYAFRVDTDPILNWINSFL
ncbi:MAG: S1 family peptidase [Methanomassiliicoccales archaeon]|nr:S1 family peptidase [Methanomassiliicoccales archaeon]